MDDIREKDVLADLTEIISATASAAPQDVRAESRLAEDLGIDSLTLVEIVVATEDRFGMIIADDDWSRFTTVGDIASHLRRAAVLRR